MLTPSNTETLVAQVRDVIVNAAKASTVSITGKEMRESDQRNTIDRAGDVAFELIREITDAVAVGGEFPALVCDLKKINDAAKTEVVLVIADEGIDWHRLHACRGRRVALVLTNPEQFDASRPAFQVDADQRVLPMGAGDDEPNFDDDGVIIAQNGLADPVAVEGGGLGEPPFSAMEAAEELWTVLHGAVEVYTPVADEEHANAVAAALNSRAIELDRDLSPSEVRALVLSMSIPGGTQPFLVGPYSAEAMSVVAETGVAPAEKPGRGRISAAELLLIECDGWDAAAAGKPDTVSPYKGTRHVRWLTGHLHQKDGKPRPTEVGSAANDDGQPLFGSSDQGQDVAA